VSKQRQDPNLDPAVAAILGHQERKEKIRKAPRREAAELRRQAARHRVTLELDPAVVKVLQQVAEAEGVSPAAACNWLLGNALAQYAGGDLDFSECKQGSESHRWAFVVELGELAGTLEQIAQTGF
jgi:hypothetical protein